MIAPAVSSAWIGRPLPLSSCPVHEVEGAARDVRSTHPPARRRRHVVDLRLPPCPDVALDSVSFCSIEKGAGYSERSSCMVSQIPFRSGPPVGMFDDELVVPESAQDRGGVPGGDAEDSCCGVHRQAAELAKCRVDLAGEMAEAAAGEEVVALVGQLFLECRDQIGAFSEEFGRGAGVI